MDVFLFDNRIVIKNGEVKNEVPFENIYQIYHQMVHLYVGADYKGLQVDIVVNLKDGRLWRFGQDLKDIQLFLENLLQATTQYLLDNVRQGFEKGEIVEFGKIISLSKSELIINKNIFRWNEVENIGIQEGNLIIDCKGNKNFSFPTGVIANLPVLFLLADFSLGRTPQLSSNSSALDSSLGEEVPEKETSQNESQFATDPLSELTSSEDLRNWLQTKNKEKVCGLNIGFFIKCQITGWFLVLLGLGLFALALVVGQNPQARPGSGYILGIPIGSLFFFPGAYILFYAFKAMSGKVICFDEGFVCQFGKKMDGCRWKEIRMFWRTGQHGKQTLYYQGWNLTLVLKRWLGNPIEINTYLTSSAFLSTLREKTMPYLLPIAKAALSRGETLTFDDFTVDSNGIKMLGQGGMDWSEIQKAYISSWDDIWVLNKVDKRKQLGRGNALAIPNAHILIALVKDRAGLEN